jgi:hypothetical protein
MSTDSGSFEVDRRGLVCELGEVAFSVPSGSKDVAASPHCISADRSSRRRFRPENSSADGGLAAGRPLSRKCKRAALFLGSATFRIPAPLTPATSRSMHEASSRAAPEDQGCGVAPRALALLVA